LTNLTDNIGEIIWDGAATIRMGRRKAVDDVMLALPRTLMSIFICLFRNPPDDFHSNNLSAMQKTGYDFSDEEMMRNSVVKKLV
jgi:hypothetical protein